MPDDRTARNKRPRQPHRSPPRYYAKQIRQYATRTGLALWAWNSLHANLFHMFWFLLESGKPGPIHPAVRGIWHAVQNDSTQREMLLALATHELAGRPAMLERVAWIIRQTNILAAYRNIAAHTPAIFSAIMDRVPAADPTASRSATEKKFNEIDHARFWKLLAGDLNALSDYALLVSWEVVLPGEGLDGPLPGKPRLLSLPLIRSLDDRINRLAQTAEKSRQPPSSHPKRQRRRERT